MFSIPTVTTPIGLSEFLRFQGGMSESRRHIRDGFLVYQFLIIEESYIILSISGSLVFDPIKVQMADILYSYMFPDNCSYKPIYGSDNPFEYTLKLFMVANSSNSISF